MKNPARMRGRPRKRPIKQGDRVSLAFRITPALKDALDRATKQSGRSQSQEAEFRIERTFLDQQSMIEALELTYGRDLAGILQIIGDAMLSTGKNAGFMMTCSPEGSENWCDDATAFAEATEAARFVLNEFKPSGEVKSLTMPTPLQTIGDPVPAWVSEAEHPRLAHKVSALILEEAATGRAATPNVDRAPRLNRAAGRLAERINSFASPEFRDAGHISRTDQ
jgi:hypothetical protein